MAAPERPVQIVVLERPRYLDKDGLARELSCSKRWIERRMEEGMPHRHLAGRAKFRMEEVEPWLEQHGHIERKGEAA